MGERLGKGLALAGILAASIGTTACGNSRPAASEAIPRPAKSSACDGGLPPVKEVAGDRFTFRFPKACDETSVGVYRDNGRSTGHALRPGEPFRIVCQSGPEQEPPSVLVRVPHRGSHPAFQGLVNLSHAAILEFAHQIDLESLPNCDAS